MLVTKQSIRLSSGPGYDTAFRAHKPMTTDDLQRQLEPLIERWRHETSVGPRAKVLQQILSAMNRSGKLWRGPGVPRELYIE